VCHPFSGDIHSSKEEEALTCRKLCTTPAPMVSTPKKDDAPTCRTPCAVTRRGHAPVAFMARGGRTSSPPWPEGAARPSPSWPERDARRTRDLLSSTVRSSPRRVSQRGSRRGPIGAPEAPPPNFHENPACSRRSSRIVGFAPATGRELAPSSTRRRTPCCFLPGELAAAPPC
jgi:hypothetical protein